MLEKINRFLQGVIFYVTVLAVASITSAHSQVSTIIVPGVSIVVPETFKQLSDDDIKLKWFNTRNPPLKAFGNSTGATTISFSIGNLDISRKDYEQFSLELEKGLASPSNKIFKREIISINGKNWILIETESTAIDTTIHNLLLVTSLRDKMLGVNFNSTVLEFKTYQDRLLKSMKTLKIH